MLRGVLDIPYGEADKLAKLIPVVRGKPYKLNEMIDKNSPSQEFRDKYINDNRVKKWVDLALRICLLYTSPSPRDG